MPMTQNKIKSVPAYLHGLVTYSNNSTFELIGAATAPKQDTRHIETAGAIEGGASNKAKQARKALRIHPTSEIRIERSTMNKPYSKEIEVMMQEMYNCIPEEDRFLYAGIEALKLPHDGVDYISKLFGCSHDTVLLGIKEINKGVLRK